MNKAILYEVDENGNRIVKCELDVSASTHYEFDLDRFSLSEVNTVEPSGQKKYSLKFNFVYDPKKRGKDFSKPSGAQLT